jgi:heat shock protein HslJ
MRDADTRPILVVVVVSAGVLAGAGAPMSPAPAWDELRGATFRGILEAAQPVTLRDGRWEGAAPVEGGASRPRLELVGPFQLSGDLNGDGSGEAVVLLAGSSGGTGTNTYLAVVGRRDGRLENLGTACIGDRVQLRAAALEGRRIRLDVVQAGPRDAACCPGEMVRRSYELAGDHLVEPTPPEPRGRLALTAVADRAWVLRAWHLGEAAPATPAVTLVFKDGRLSGNAGCNNYFLEAKDGDVPGEWILGRTGSTEKLCPRPVMDAEARFLQQLRRATRYGFHLGRLAVTYPTADGVGTMLFEASNGVVESRYITGSEGSR